MITVTEAYKIIRQVRLHLPDQLVDLPQSLGRILAETIVADRDFPPFDRVTMDGIAINYQQWESGQYEFAIESTQAAGAPASSLANLNCCVEVMTGAVLPEHCDTVIRYEDLEISDNHGARTAKIITGPNSFRQNVHRQGTDRRKGATILSPGRWLTAAEIAVAATVGKHQIKVRSLPKVAIISTGDELVAVKEKPLPHQIRGSNVVALQAAFKSWGIDALLFHLIDKKALIQKELERILSDFDMLVLSGGVSKGKFDFVPAVLEDLGVKKLFHRIAQRPGKPFWFGTAQNHRVVFALPGNPVSTFMCYHRYLKPWVDQQLGINNDPLNAVLAQDFTFTPDLTYFLQVKTTFDSSGILMAHPIEGKGSGDLANLVDADGFLELPQGQDEFKAGCLFPLYPYRDLLNTGL